MEKNTGRHTLVILTFSCYVLPHIETSKLICIANQYTGLYMRGNISMKKVKKCWFVIAVFDCNLWNYKIYRTFPQVDGSNSVMKFRLRCSGQVISSLPFNMRILGKYHDPILTRWKALRGRDCY